MLLLAGARFHPSGTILLIAVILRNRTQTQRTGCDDICISDHSEERSSTTNPIAGSAVLLSEPV